MFKLGTIIALTTSTTSAVASPYVVPYANIDLDRKEYSADKLLNDISFFIQNKYEGEPIALDYINNITHLLASGQNTHDAAFRNAIEDKIEEAYLSDPFIDGGLVFDPIDDMRYNIANIITNWFDQNPTWGVGQSTVGLVSVISSIPVGSTGETFNFIESKFESWITSIRNFGVAQNNFNDIESSMQTVVDNESVHDSPYYMDINEFYDWTSDEIMNGKNHNTIKSEMEIFNNTQSTDARTRINELQFNVAENDKTIEDDTTERQTQLDKIIDAFKGSNDFESASNSLDTLDADFYKKFVDGLVSDIEKSIKSMNPKPLLGESLIGITSDDLSDFFLQEDVVKFQTEYAGAKVNIETNQVTTFASNQSTANVLLEVIDTKGVMIAESTYTTNWESDALAAHNFIDVMEWDFYDGDIDSDGDSYTFEELVGSEKEGVLTPSQVDELYIKSEESEGYEDFLTKHLNAIVGVKYELSDPDQSTTNSGNIFSDESIKYILLTLTFDISSTISDYDKTVTKEHKLIKYNDKLLSTFRDIEEQLDYVVISELKLRVEGILSQNIDISKAVDQQKFLGIEFDYNSDEIELKASIVYDKSYGYITDYAKVHIELTNIRTNEDLVPDISQDTSERLSLDISVSMIPIIFEASQLLKEFDTQHLYKEYVKQWSEDGTDVKNIILKTEEMDLISKWIFDNLLDEVIIDDEFKIEETQNTLPVSLGFLISDKHPPQFLNTVVEVEAKSSKYSNPLNYAQAVFSAYNYRDSSKLNEQLLAITDKDKPTKEDIDSMIEDFSLNVGQFENLVIDGHDPITVSIGSFKEIDNSPYNVLTLSDSHGNVTTVTIWYDTNLVSRIEIFEFNEELMEHTIKVEYILDELVLEENIAEGNSEGAKFALVGLVDQYEKEAPTKTNDEWEDYKESTLERLYGIFGVAWSGEDTNTQLIIDEIHEDYPEGIPSSIQNRIDDYIAGITVMPYPLNSLDTDDLDTVVDTILALTKTVFLVEPTEVSIPSKIILMSIASSLGGIALLSLSTSFVAFKNNRTMQKTNPSVSYTQPKRQIFTYITTSLLSAAGATALALYVLVSSGGF